MRRSICLAIFLLAFFSFSIGKAYAFLPLPRGEYDEGFWYDGRHLGWFYDGGINITWSNQFSASFGYEPFTTGIYSHYLQIDTSASTSTSIIKIPSDDVDYILICYKLYAYGSTCISGRTSSIYLSFNNSNVKTIDQISGGDDEVTSDRKCVIVNIHDFEYPHSEYKINFGTHTSCEGYGHGYVRLYAIQFLNSSFEPINPTDRLIKVYESNYYQSNLDDIYDPFTNYGYSQSANVTYAKVFHGSDYNILHSSENYWKNFTVESSTPNEFWVWANPSVIYHNMGWSADTNLNSYLVEADIWQKPGTYSANSLFKFTIREMLNSTYTNAYTQFVFNRTSGKMDYYLLDHDLNVLEATTGVSFSIPSNPFRLIFYRPPYQISNISRLMLVSQSTTSSEMKLIGITNDYIVSSNTQQLLFQTDDDTEVDLSTYKYYYEVYREPPPTNAQISWSSTNVSTQQEDTYTVTWENGRPPFNVTVYYENPSEPGQYSYTTYPNVNEHNVTGNIIFGYPGDSDTYAVITDAEGRTVETNHVTVHVYSPPSPINDFHTVINGHEGLPYHSPINISVHYNDVLNVTLWNVSGGTPPYTAYVQDITSGYTWSKTFSGSSIQFNITVTSDAFVCTSSNQKNISETEVSCENDLITKIVDSENNTKSEGPHYIYLIKAVQGPTLYANLSVIPNQTVTVDTNVSLTINVSGGTPPYHIIVYDTVYTVLCDYVTDNSTSHLIVYLHNGDHDLWASVESADGQTTTTNEVIINDVSSGPTHTNRYKDYVIGCTGTTSGYATTNEGDSLTGVITPPPTNISTPSNLTKPIQGINETEWREAGYGWALFFFSPMFLETIFLMIISGVFAKLVGGDHKGPVFLLSLTVLIGIATALGGYPVWIGIILIIIGAGIFAFMMKKAF